MFGVMVFLRGSPNQVNHTRSGSDRGSAALPADVGFALDLLADSRWARRSQQNDRSKTPGNRERSRGLSGCL